MGRKTMLSHHLQCLLPVLLCFAIAASKAQLSPVYTPGGDDDNPVAPMVVEATPVVMARAVGSSSPDSAALRPAPRDDHYTKTVYGFLDFTTTVGDTVMVFTPQSKADESAATTAATKTPSSLSGRKAPDAPNVTPKPTRTVTRVTATAVPYVAPKVNTKGPSELESSFFEPATTLALEELFSSTPTVPEPPPQSKAPPTTPKAKTPPNRPFAFRHRSKDRDESTGSRRRLDLNYFLARKKGDADRRTGGSTLVPITVEGTGTLTERATRVTPVSQPSQVPLVTPSEVVVSATQGFASLSVIGPFSTAINNELGQVSQHYDFLSSQPLLEARRSYDVVNVDAVDTASSFPTGLVTKMGGTIVAEGHTTVHETSVIGTYIDGQYAQVLRSTSRIFQTPPLSPVYAPRSKTPSPVYETVQAVIEGSATQFITPEATASLPLESLFTEQPGGTRGSRKAQGEQSFIQARLRSALSKRRGSQELSFQGRSHSHDPFVDEEEEHDLQRSGTNLRPSFKQYAPTATRKTPDVRTSVRRTQEVNSDPLPRTFRPRYKPTATRRVAGGRPTRQRASPAGPKRAGRPGTRPRPGAAQRPKPTGNRRPAFPQDEYEQQQAPQESLGEVVYQPSPEEALSPSEAGEETLRVVTSTVANEDSEVLVEVATVRSLHTFRVGITRNTRYVTFTKTFTLDIEPTPAPDLDAPDLDAPDAAVDDHLYQTEMPLFENILDNGVRDVSTLPPVEIGVSDLAALLETVTETYSTTEVMEKTSVLPVLQSGSTSFHTLTQTYHIARVVTALKTMPPYEAFSFIPENSLNEFNGQLLAEGSENDEALLPGEVELDPNGEVVVRDPSLAQLAGGEFNPDALEQQLHPELAAALQQRQQQQQQQQAQPAQQANPLGGVPQLLPGQLGAPSDPSGATPGLTPEQMQQLAYLRLLSPYSFGGFPPVQAAGTTVTSSPVTITTDITTTSTRVFRVIFNARPIMTTISSVEVVHTTLTTYATSTVTVAPSLPAFPFPFPSPFQVG
ncbi:uncharacterized protein LOC127003550 isoform X2 [Eriocheir sinensis]|uniref:uncharacterized protein LOC127003550 isoform X2 n=1 Tax=Eriocheir sinensis TaxID=95602 RepID=UPI0021C92930|nr:uncharacterized protein LOC127003550 isoform X2 [Eriocheir sinensis]